MQSLTPYNIPGDDLELQICDLDAGKLYLPIVFDEMRLERHRKGAPSKLTFSVMKAGNLNFHEGDRVTIQAKTAGMSEPLGVFWGYIFKKERTKENKIKVTAYDQLYYLKNEDSIKYGGDGDPCNLQNLVQKIANITKLQHKITGESRNLPKRIEESSTYFDIIQTAIDTTASIDGNLFVLYDDYGWLKLSNIEDLKINDIQLTEGSAEDFNYSTDIETNTYNEVKILYDNPQTNTLEAYIERDLDSIARWGLLRKTDTVVEKARGIEKARTLLKLHNRVNRNLSGEKMHGDIRVRGGTSIPVTLALGDLVLNEYLFIEDVVHMWKGGKHTMDVTFRSWVPGGYR